MSAASSSSSASLRVRLSSLLSLSSAGVVALTFFLPAVRGCTQPVRPIEVPALSGIYGFAIIVAILAVYVLRGRIASRVLGWVAWVYALGGSLANLVNCLYILIDVDGGTISRWHRMVLVGFALTSLGGCGLLVSGVRRRGRRVAWAALAGSTQVFLFFVRIVLTEPLSNILYGLWTSLLASFLMTLGCLLIWDRLAVED